MGRRGIRDGLIGFGLAGLLLAGCAVPAPTGSSGAAPGAGPAVAPAGAQAVVTADQVTPAGITVVGEGQARARPDQATLRLGVETTGQTAQAAMDQNSQAMAKVVQALKGAGVADQQIQTTGFSLIPVQEQPRPVTPGAQQPSMPRIIGYRASNNVVVVVSKIDQAGPVIDAAIGAGANAAGGPQFGLKDPSQLKAQALEAAVKAAQAEADTIARTLGVKIVGVVAVSEEGGVQPVGLDRMPAALAAPAAPVPVEAGELTLTVRVRVTFRF